MQKLTERVVDLVDKAMGRQGLAYDEMEYLYGVDPRSRDAALIRWAADQMAREATNGKAEIHA